MNKKKICILSFSNIDRDSRVLREIKCCRDKYQTSVIGYGDWQPPENVQYIRLSKNRRNLIFLARYFFWLILGRLYPLFYERAFWLKREYNDAVNLIAEGNYSLVHANDLDTLPVAIIATAKLKTRVLFDAHEFSPEQEADRLIWRILVKPYKAFLLRKYLYKIDEMITVSPGIRDYFIKKYKKYPKIILNASNYKKSRFAQVDDHMINIVHHGYAVPGRYLEEMIRMIALTDERYNLNFILVAKNGSDYIWKLKKISQRIAPNKVIFWDPVEPSRIVSFINKFDLGLPFLKASNLNIQNALPNKFFDFIMAGLGVIVPSLPAMGEIVKKYNNGVVIPTQSIFDMAKMLNTLNNEEINLFKQNSLLLAKEYNAEHEMTKLMKIYRDVLAA